MAAADFFLSFEGIKGESQDHKHKDEIDIESFSWGCSNTGSFATGGGGGSGKASFQDVHFTMKANKASPDLFLSCCTGDHIKKATLVVRKAGKDQQEFYKVTFEDVLVSSYQTGGGGEGLPVDQFSLNFTKIDFSYAPQKADGKLATAITRKYDIKQQKA